MTYRGHVKHGAIILDEAAELPEGAEVDVAIRPAPKKSPTFYDRFVDLIGACPDLPTDMAQNHDHYLHGQEKK